MPDVETLERLDRAIHTLAQHWSMTPETMWRVDESGAFEPNGFHGLFSAWLARKPKRVVAHGVGFSVGTPRREVARREAWLAQLREDVREFPFEWYTDHLGSSRLGGQELTLPLPLLMTDASARRVRLSLDELRTVVPDVGVENSVFYFHLGSPLDEPAFLSKCTSAPRSHLLLDVHNVFTTSVNARFDPLDYLARLPLERVIEIHLSGGRDSEPSWLPERRVRRLDSHDDAIPAEVWALFEHVLPRCPNLRAVTIERMERTVQNGDERIVEDEMQRALRTVELVRG